MSFRKMDFLSNWWRSHVTRTTITAARARSTRKHGHFCHVSRWRRIRNIWCMQNERRGTMKKFAAVLLMGLFATAAVAKSHVPSKNTHAAIKSYVKAAAAVVAKKGPSCETFSSKDWASGDYYIFVLG